MGKYLFKVSKDTGKMFVEVFSLNKHFSTVRYFILSFLENYRKLKKIAIVFLFELEEVDFTCNTSLGKGRVCWNA